MTITLIVHQNRQIHLHHLRESLERLRAASAKWIGPDRERGEKTIRNLERQVEGLKTQPFRAA
ncbi:hypothetical protein [Pseudomonas lundensis]|uniref:hypothetical protein n=1 Tax=Pseudomonas lundensis TaxID=86185 RepID=UPI00089DCB9A|nr:hypothetical protein [Pseudomonas lundensis]